MWRKGSNFNLHSIHLRRIDQIAMHYHVYLDFTDICNCATHILGLGLAQHIVIAHTQPTDYNKGQRFDWQGVHMPCAETTLLKWGLSVQESNDNPDKGIGQRKVMIDARIVSFLHFFFDGSILSARDCWQSVAWNIRSSGSCISALSRGPTRWGKGWLRGKLNSVLKSALCQSVFVSLLSIWLCMHVHCSIGLPGGQAQLLALLIIVCFCLFCGPLKFTN